MRWPARFAPGIMFTGHRRLDHDGWVQAAIAAAAAATAEETADAFLASLAMRRLDLRSALGSFVLARHLRKHPFTIPRNLAYQGYAPVGPTDCAVCGFRSREAKEQDLNIYNFERFKWGGTRRHSVPCIAFGLEQFARALEMPASPWAASSSATSPACPPASPPRKRPRE
jgi:hypothetical protein